LVARGCSLSFTDSHSLCGSPARDHAFFDR
jgi:hypothetical protein